MAQEVKSEGTKKMYPVIFNIPVSTKLHSSVFISDFFLIDITVIFELHYSLSHH